MNPKEIRGASVNQSRLAKEKKKWWASVKTVMNLRVP